MSPKIWPPRQDDSARLSHPAHWTDAAACQYFDGDFWFVEVGESTVPAKAVCRGCTVREQCLAMALDRNEEFGVWGSLSRQERLHAARLAADGWSIADIITAYDAAFYARADAAEEAKERKRAAEREYREQRRSLKRDTMAEAA